HVHPVDDSDLTWEKMDEYYTANLVNGLGNLTARIMKMAETHLESPVKVEQNFVPLPIINDLKFQLLMDAIWKTIQELDEMITREEPFKLVKTDKAAALPRIEFLVKELFTLGI